MIKLELKIRKRGDTLRLSKEQLRAWMSQPEEIAKQSLYNFFAPLKDDKPTVHDYVFVQQVIDWIPINEKTGVALGLPMKEQVRLIRLTEQLIPFDDAKDPEPGFINLSTKDVDLLWGRMDNDKFLVGAISPPYAAFLMDFQEATGKWFKVFEDEQKEAEEAKELKGKEDGRKPAEIPEPNAIVVDV